MHYKTIPGVDKPISRLVQGTVMINSGEVDKSFALLDAVLAQGCTAFDTAHVYGQGDCERTVGRWVNDRQIREKVVIIGKGAHPNQDRRRVAPFDISSDIFDSLVRFKFEYIDLYLLHRDDPAVPVGPIIEVLNEHLKAGRIRAFGGSNWTPARIQEANAYADAHGLVPFIASSPNLSLAEQVKEPWAGCVTISGPQGAADRAWYAQQQMPLFTWSSLAGGFFSGRFTRENLDKFTSYLDVLCVQSYCYEPNFKRLDRAAKLADAKGVTLPQIALAYVLNLPLNVFALVGCASGTEFKQNAEAMALPLSASEMAWLDLMSDVPPSDL